METVKIIMRANELGINLIELGRAYISSEEKAGFVMQKSEMNFILLPKHLIEENRCYERHR